MWACYQSVSWLRSPEYAAAWCAFSLGVSLWVLATRGRDAAMRLVRQARWVVAAQLAVILSAVEVGRWMHRGKGNPSDLYTIASLALAAGWGVQLVLFVRSPRKPGEGTPKEPFKVGTALVTAVSLLCVLSGVAFVLSTASSIFLWFASEFSVIALEAMLVFGVAVTVTAGWLCFAVEDRRSVLIGASIALMMAAVPVGRMLGPKAARTQVFVLTDGCAADQFLFHATNGGTATAILEELASRDRPRFATLEATLRALHRSRGTKEPPGEYLLPERLATPQGEAGLLSPMPYHGFADAALLRILVERGQFGEPMAWLRDPAISEETRTEVADALCSKAGLMSAACTEAAETRGHGP